MKKKTLCCLLALCLLFTAFAGCGTTPATTADTLPSVTSTVEDSTPAPAAEVAASTAVASEPEADSAQDGTFLGRGITLPIAEEPVTYTYWLCYAPFAAELVDTNTLEGILVLDTIQEESGIHFDFVAANGAADRDNFNLMIAAGDYCDIIFDMSYYATGLEGAVEEGIIQDLADILPEKCPTYWHYLTMDTTTLMAAYTDSGYMPTICALTPEVGQEAGGPVLRKDWLDEFGMDMPETYDELYLYFEQAYRDKGAMLSLQSTDGLSVDLGYGENLNLGGYEIIDGEVEYALASERLKNYLGFMNRLYTAGIISQDFFAPSNSDLGLAARTAFGAGTNSFVSTGANITSDIMMNVTDDSFEMAVMPYVSQDAATENHVGASQLQEMMKDNDAWAFSTECDDIDPLLDLVEYLFSDDAYLLTNYGIEGTTYTLDENGLPQYTDLIINNPDGLSYFFASYVYATNAAWAFVPFLNDMSRTYYDFNDNQWQVYEDLKTLSDCAWNYPEYAVMTTEESTEYTSIESDLSTYADSMILRFIVGSANLEEDFDDYINTLYDMGLQDMLDLKQAAYDRAKARAESLTA